MQQDINSISAALKKAQKDNVIIIASASNEGGNRTITFPARLKNVFCICSADGKGFPSRFNLPIEAKKQAETFSALGEGVKGACPMTSKTETETSEPPFTRMFGTSVAAPIVAGIAAILIDYTRQYLDPGEGINTFHNLCTLFDAISRTTIGPYRYLVPWALFEGGRDGMAVVRKALRKPSFTRYGRDSTLQRLEKELNALSCKMSTGEFAVFHSAGVVVMRMAQAYEKVGMYEEALPQWLRKLDMYEKYYGLNHDQLRFPLHFLGLCYERLERWDDVQRVRERRDGLVKR